MENKEEKVYISREGLNQMIEELDRLKNVERIEVIERIKIARSFGDLSENSEYDSAKDDQGKIEARIGELEYKIANAVVFRKTSSSKVKVGSKVTFIDLGDKNEYTYQIVGPDEVAPEIGNISNNSPLGEALFGKEIDEEPEFFLPNGKLRKVKITKID